MGKGLSGATPAWRPPHVRGEDNAKTGQARPERETPPRAWGRHTFREAEEGYRGNTPTCVGKTELAHGDEVREWKHPHVRGEDKTPALYVLTMTGNTPTCVGKT